MAGVGFGDQPIFGQCYPGLDESSDEFLARFAGIGRLGTNQRPSCGMSSEGWSLNELGRFVRLPRHFSTEGAPTPSDGPATDARDDECNRATEKQ